jgi:hypothetical protein
VTSLNFIDGGLLPNSIKIGTIEQLDGEETQVVHQLTSFLNVKNCFKLMQKKVDEAREEKPVHYL